MRIFKSISPILIGLSLVSTSAFAAETSLKKKKFITGESVFEFHANDNLKSSNKDNKYLESFGRNETAVNINFTNNFGVESMFVLEPLKSKSLGREDRSFESEGIFIEELKLKYDGDNFSVFGGKFNPNFGRAWDYGRGIWTHKLAEQYEQTEKLGGGASVTAFNHTLGISAFHNDVKVLDGSTITKRDGGTRDDGVPGNTDNFRSYNISLDGENPFGVEGWSYNFDFLNLATDQHATLKDQRGYVIGTNYVFDLNKNVNFDTLVEGGGFDNFEGNIAKDREFITANIITTIKENWNVTTGYAQINDMEENLPTKNQKLFQLSGGYKFKEDFILPGLTVEIGYKNLYENDGTTVTKTNSIGLLSRYRLEF